MTVTTVPTGHFQGGRGVNVSPTTGDDVRSLETILQSIVTDLNAATAKDVVQDGQITAIVDDHVNCVCAGINPKTDESEVSAALSGDVAKHFMPTHVAIEVTALAGSVNADCTINIGTSTGGVQIGSALACTGLTTLGAIRLHPIAAATQTILGNATLYANIEAPMTGTGTATYKVTIIGRQF